MKPPPRPKKKKIKLQDMISLEKGLVYEKVRENKKVVATAL